MSDESKLTGNAYVTVYHTGNVTVCIGWLTVPLAILALAAAWKAVAS